jgi:iron complex transport system ATP-binding protein
MSEVGPSCYLTDDLELALATADRVWLLPKGGSLVAGAPEDLVLSGEFSAAFSSEGVHFDEESGTFSIRRTFGGEVDLIGEGAANRWTKRAVECGGYRISAAGRVRAKVGNVSGLPKWEVSSTGKVIRQDSIEELLSVLPALMDEHPVRTTDSGS